MALFYLSALYKAAPYNETHWSSPSADHLLFDALSETNDATAEQKWYAVQELQFDQGGYIVTNNFNWLDAYAPKVRGIQTTPPGPVTITISRLHGWPPDRPGIAWRRCSHSRRPVGDVHLVLGESGSGSRRMLAFRTRHPIVAF